MQVATIGSDVDVRTPGKAPDREGRVCGVYVARNGTRYEVLLQDGRKEWLDPEELLMSEGKGDVGPAKVVDASEEGS